MVVVVVVMMVGALALVVDFREVMMTTHTELVHFFIGLDVMTM